MIVPTEDIIQVKDYVSLAKTMNRPSFYSTLFPEVPITLCCPLDPPFDKFAVTTHGTVFQFKPLHTVHFSFNPLESTVETYIDPMSCCVPKRDHENRLYVVLMTYYGMHYTFYIDELICQYFYNVPSDQHIQIEYHDGDYDNVSYNNLEAWYV